MQLDAYGPDGAAKRAELVHSVYSAEYPPGPEFDAWRDGLWARHRGRPGFRLLVARDGSAVTGIAWAYIGDRGQYWSDAVAASIPPATADAWVGGHLEVVELIVVPEFWRRGVGRALLTALVDGTSADRALLTVRDTAGPARALYRSLGWRELGRLGSELTVMGLDLRRP